MIINKYRRMYNVFQLGYGGTTQWHFPRMTKAPASRQLSAGRTRYGSMLVSLARGTLVGRVTRHSTVVSGTSHFISPIMCMSLRGIRPSRVAERACRAARRSWMKPRGPAFSRYVRIIARTAFAVINNLYCIPSYVVWMMALRLVRPVSASIYWKIEGLMYHWLLAMVALWSWTAGYEIVETGDEPVACYGRRTLVLANHQSTADVPMLMAAWNPRGDVLPNLMWIMDRVFKFTNFGIVSVLHEDFFIQAGKAKRDQSLEELRQHIHRYYMPLGRQFMVLFPEGGFLHKRREVSQRFAEKNNLPKLEYVSLPRAGALKVIMEEIGPHRDQDASTSKDSAKKDKNFNQSPNMILDNNAGDSVEWVLDVTIAYPDRIPLHLQDVVCGLRHACTTHLHYRLYPSTEVPADTEGMTQWLYDRFIEKDKMLEEYYKTGQFPSKSTTPLVARRVRQDNVRFLILHLFFIASTFVQFKMMCTILGFFW